MRARIVLGVLGIATAGILFTGCTTTPTPEQTGDATSAPATATPDASPSPEATPDGTCEYVTSPNATPAKDVELPSPDTLDEDELRGVISTSAGEIAFTLDGEKAPCTVASFHSLAVQDYFNDTSCHRLVTQGIHILQCGDPTGTGRGGPGYSFADELAGDEKYEAGTIAMANAGPNTNGSQFFLVYEDTFLSPEYTVFGHMDDESIDIVAAVAEEGNAPNGTAPARAVDIESVTFDTVSE